MRHFHVAETVSQFRRARVYLGEEIQLGQTIKTIPLRQHMSSIRRSRGVRAAGLIGFINMKLKVQGR